MLCVTEKYLKDNGISRPSQHGFTNRKFCLTNLIFFQDKIIHAVDTGKIIFLVGLLVLSLTVFFWKNCPTVRTGSCYTE